MKNLSDKDTMVDTAVGEGIACEEIRKVEPDWTISQDKQG
ncbi:hypothetical protein Xoosp13_91 [Xanthomonas phage Xoo-sp13]|nr:hypothetical protein Xoosp13_91 [Xanthomonas phage Xoo-sp13]